MSCLTELVRVEFLPFEAMVDCWIALYGSGKGTASLCHQFWDVSRFDFPLLILERVLTFILLPFSRSTSRSLQLVDPSSFWLDLDSLPSFVLSSDSPAPSPETSPSPRRKPSNPRKLQQNARTSSSGSSPKSLRSPTSSLPTPEGSSSSSQGCNPERSSTGLRGGSTSPLESSSQTEPSESSLALRRRRPS